MNHQARGAGGLAPSVIVQSPLLAALDWLEHGFGTRLSPNWPPEGYVNLRQIHSDIVVVVAAEGAGAMGHGDAIVSNRPGPWTGVRTADCAPLILADPRHRAAAVVHAGWRGTVHQIALRALDRMAAEFGTRPEEAVAAIGPAIGACCYEVGADVARQFAPWWPERTDLDGQTYVDVAETLRRQLLAAGVRAAYLGVTGECTRCGGAGRYHSFRRDGAAAGRMVSAFRILGGAGAGLKSGAS